MDRIDGRKPDELREVAITANFLEVPLSSALVEFGRTKVICAVSLDEKVPRWMKDPRQVGAHSGWLTSEYSMAPFSSGQGRMVREATRGKVGGRTYEIQRLIGRCLRAVVDLDKLGENTLWVDCDVIQADGGTRTASITGGFVAVAIAIERLKSQKLIKENIYDEFMAAVSVGIVDGQPVLDLCYDEDSAAQVDMNVVMTESGKFIEVQGTAEKYPYTADELQEMLALAGKGVKELVAIQKECFDKVVMQERSE